MKRIKRMNTDAYNPQGQCGRRIFRLVSSDIMNVYSLGIFLNVGCQDVNMRMGCIMVLIDEVRLVSKTDLVHIDRSNLTKLFLAKIFCYVKVE